MSTCPVSPYPAGTLSSEVGGNGGGMQHAATRGHSIFSDLWTDLPSPQITQRVGIQVSAGVLTET